MLRSDPGCHSLELARTMQRLWSQLQQYWQRTMQSLRQISKMNATPALCLSNSKNPGQNRRRLLILTYRHITWYGMNWQLWMTVLSESLQKWLTDIAHQTHQGIVHTKQLLKELYSWPKIDTHVGMLIEDCTTCRRNDKSVVTHNAPLHLYHYLLLHGKRSQLTMSVLLKLHQETAGLQLCLWLMDVAPGPVNGQTA